MESKIYFSYKGQIFPIVVSPGCRISLEYLFDHLIDDNCAVTAFLDFLSINFEKEYMRIMLLNIPGGLIVEYMNKMLIAKKIEAETPIMNCPHCKGTIP